MSNKKLDLFGQKTTEKECSGLIRVSFKTVQSKGTATLLWQFLFSYLLVV